MVGGFLFFMSKPTNTRLVMSYHEQALLALLIAQSLCLRDKRKRRIR